MRISKFSLFHNFFSSNTLDNITKKSKSENKLKINLTFPQSDKVMISKNSKDFLQIKDVYLKNPKIRNLNPKIVKIIQDTPDVRKEKIDQFKQKINNEHYMKSIDYDVLFFKIIKSSEHFLLKLY